MTAPTQQYYRRSEVVALAHERGLTHITEHSVAAATYHNDRPLKRTKIHGRVYYSLTDIDAWLAGERLD